MSFLHPLSKRPYHIPARPGDVAPRVVAMGDPERTRKAAKLLEGARVINEHRGYLAVTGTYRGVPVTLATHGIGAPSAAIVFEELAMLGAKAIVRAGTCGALAKEIGVGTAFVAEGAAYEPGGTIGLYVGPTSFPAVPTPELVIALERAARRLGLRVARGLVISSDAFHRVEAHADRWAGLGISAVEMECATLFAIGRLRGLVTGCIALVIDNVATGEELREGREELELEVVRAALEAVTEIPGQELGQIQKGAGDHSLK
ncbi:MAG: nucleoside phosphorylase [Desulfurococcaceae archaeon]